MSIAHASQIVSLRPTPLLAPGRPVRVRALLFGDRLERRVLEGWRVVASAPTVLEREGGFLVFLRYGAVVLFGVDDEEEAAVVGALTRDHPEGGRPLEEEAVMLVVEEGAAPSAAEGCVTVAHADAETLQVIAESLARCAVLSHWEERVKSAFERLEPYVDGLEHKGEIPRPGTGLVKHIASTLRIQNQMVGRVEVRERPDVLWERPDLGRLWTRLDAEYELAERDAALDRKLDVVSRTASTLLGIRHNRQSLLLELSIVLLIIGEIALLILWEMWLK